ncbi:ABC transporter substrate-binding protein [Falsirhodobacter xinxiangensis]|uniref:ABC transporter substrate-binding protein n=1 Tax=Falsirhodobacter xinxiangensis TaxID=2530049 RepID=UPI00145AFB08|nr:ABC transporter substrate-binding protein [Rhodobacter xinxiangensis]
MLSTPFVARAQAGVPISLDFRIYGGNAPFFLGSAQGIFEQLGFVPTFDGAAGSAESVRRVATGTHQFGFADVATLVEFAVSNPEDTPKLIMGVFDHGPQTLLSIGAPIASLEDLKGKRLGIGANSAATKLMPALMKLNGIAEGEIEFVNVDVRVRDTLLLQKEVDAVVCFDYTSIFNLVESGVSRDDMHMLHFSDFGFNFPANSLIASQKMIDEQPDLCRAVALGVARSWRAAYADPAAAVDAVVAQEPLLVKEVELQRLQFVLDTHVATASVKANGLGHVDSARMAAGTALMQTGFGWAIDPALESYYDPRFLPEAAELALA